MSRLLQMFIAFDQFVSCIIGLVIGDSWADETFSAKCWRKSKGSLMWDITMKIVNGIFLDNNHCYDSYMSEKERRQVPIEYRK